MDLPQSAPALSTPASHVFDENTNLENNGDEPTLSEEQLIIKYEIERTITEIRAARYRRIALQFPDSMLPDAPRISSLLERRLQVPYLGKRPPSSYVVPARAMGDTESVIPSAQDTAARIYILGDTSYGACCVDEVAAEHVDADAVVHYGRACLSPTARLPVVYVFTKQPLDDATPILQDVQQTFLDRDVKLILMADVSYQYRLTDIVAALTNAGFLNLHEAKIERNASSPIPNRTVPVEVSEEPSKLREWHVFHIADPPDSLLLTLSTHVASIHIYPTQSLVSGQSAKSSSISTSRALNRRYAILTSVSTVPIFGILINTLSVKNYLHMVEHVKQKILAAGKKNYIFVVGKLNAAKVANFSEIGAWVVIGCWESSLIDSKDFWRPVITPFELELALKRDDERIWSGEWTSDYQAILDMSTNSHNSEIGFEKTDKKHHDNEINEESDSEAETAPPQFDLRSGRYVSDSKPMQKIVQSMPSDTSHSKALLKRSEGELTSMGGEPSPAAEYLRTKRTWTGLGSDFEIAYEEASTAVEEGRRGIARGYTQAAAEAKS